MLGKEGVNTGSGEECGRRVKGREWKGVGEGMVWCRDRCGEGRGWGREGCVEGIGVGEGRVWGQGCGNGGVGGEKCVGRQQVQANEQLMA